MGKDPSAVVLATALAFCAFCPFYGRCNDTERDIKLKYQAEFDNKVKFAQLQKAIDEIDEAMLDYKGGAKDKLPLIRSLKSDAQLTYENYVGPVFEWCHSTNSTFDTFIRIFGDSKVSEINKNIIRNLTVSALELGFKETAKSIELFTYYKNKLKELQIAFRDISHDVQDDFGPGGVYGEEKAELQKRISNRTMFDISQKEHVKLLEELFSVLTQKIRNASEIVYDMERDLEEDNFNLYMLRVVMLFANNIKMLSDMPHTFVRVHFISDIKNIKDSCATYVNWHEYEAPF